MMKINVDIDGEYIVTKHRVDGSSMEILRSNLITDAGLEFIGAGSMDLDTVTLGSDDTAPAGTDTEITQDAVSFSRSSVVYSVSNVAPYRSKSIATFVQDAPFVSAMEFKEIGISNGINDLFSRTLLSDIDGDDATIRVDIGEKLTIQYIVSLTPAVGETQFYVADSGQTYDCTIKAAKASDSNEWRFRIDTANGVGAQTNSAFTIHTGSITTIDAFPSGQIGSNGTSIVASYVPDSKELVVTGETPDDSGSASIGSMVFTTPLGCYQIGFTPAISLDEYKYYRVALTVSWN